MYKVAILLLLTAGLVGCSSKYKTDSFRPASIAIAPSHSGHVMLARDGAYGSRQYSGSGQTVSRNLYVALANRLSKVQLADQVEPRKQAFSKARSEGLTYVFEPVIVHWEDRATQWSGLPDRLTIQFNVWNVNSEEVVASGTERASSKWFTFGGDHPQDLVPKMVETFVRRLFGT